MAIQIRRGTNAQWESNKSNIVAGEPAVTTDTGRFFVGTGNGTFKEYANMDIQTQNVTLESNWVNSNSDARTRVEKSGRLVLLALGANCTSGITSNSWNTIGTIPSGFIPSKNYYFIGFNDSGNQYILLLVNTNGYVRAYVHSETSLYLRATLPYMV